MTLLIPGTADGSGELGVKIPEQQVRCRACDKQVKKGHLVPDVADQ